MRVYALILMCLGMEYQFFCQPKHPILNKSTANASFLASHTIGYTSVSYRCVAHKVEDYGSENFIPVVISLILVKPEA